MADTTSLRTRSELIKLPTFEERVKYAKLTGKVGEDTFGFDRYFNQKLYTNPYWRNEVRPSIIARDLGNDLAMDGQPIQGIIIVHHLNPIDMDDIMQHSDFLFNPEYLICVSLQTHNYIHYGKGDYRTDTYVERTPGDTSPWKNRSDDTHAI